MENNPKNHSDWIRDSGDSTHRLNYDLNQTSIVFDLGGFKGDWTSKIFNKYNCEVYIFEPVARFHDSIKNCFSNNPKIHCYQFGLGPKDETLNISITKNGDSSSVFLEEENTEKISIKNITQFLTENNIINVDLIKINIEGGEYDLLEDLIQHNLLCVFKNIQVQFHNFIPNCAERRNKIRAHLSKTHEITYDYEFIWENWKLKI